MTRMSGRLLAGIGVVVVGLAAACAFPSVRSPMAVNMAVASPIRSLRIIPTYGAPFSGDRDALLTGAQLSAVHDLPCSAGGITITDVNGHWVGHPNWFVADGCKQRLLYVVQIGEIDYERRFILVSRMAL
jgi:hypothetical protein